MKQADDQAKAEFSEFFDEAWEWAVKVGFLLTRDKSVGEDIAQQSLLEVYRRWNEIENPSAYLRRSISNQAFNWHRRERTQREKLPLLAPSGWSTDSPDEMSDAIALLPYQQRAVVILRYYLGLSEAEIADALDCPRGTVKSAAARARDALAKEMTW